MGKATSPRVAAKPANKAIAKPASSAVQNAIAGAADIGYNVANGYADAIAAIKLVTKTAKDRASLAKGQELQLAAMALRYKSGHVVRYLMATPAYAKRVGNYDREQMYDDAARIIAKPEATSTKADRRTAIEQKACKAATESWRLALNRAFDVVRKRAPKAKVADVPATPPVDAVFASPKLANDNDAREYFRNAFAALLQTTTINMQTGATKEAKHVAFLVQSIIQDAKGAVDKALA